MKLLELDVIIRSPRFREYEKQIRELEDKRKELFVQLKNEFNLGDDYVWGWYLGSLVPMAQPKYGSRP